MAHTAAAKRLVNRMPSAVTAVYSGKLFEALATPLFCACCGIFWLRCEILGRSFFNFSLLQSAEVIV